MPAQGYRVTREVHSLLQAAPTEFQILESTVPFMLQKVAGYCGSKF